MPDSSLRVFATELGAIPTSTKDLGPLSDADTEDALVFVAEAKLPPVQLHPVYQT